QILASASHAAEAAQSQNGRKAFMKIRHYFTVLALPRTGGVWAHPKQNHTLPAFWTRVTIQLQILYKQSIDNRELPDKNGLLKLRARHGCPRLPLQTIQLLD